MILVKIRVIHRNLFCGTQILQPMRQRVYRSFFDAAVLPFVAKGDKVFFILMHILGVHTSETSDIPLGASGLTMGIVRSFPPISMNSPLQTTNDDSYSRIIIV
jgi:hypothetical protein